MFAGDYGVFAISIGAFLGDRMVSAKAGPDARDDPDRHGVPQQRGGFEPPTDGLKVVAVRVSD